MNDPKQEPRVDTFKAQFKKQEGIRDCTAYLDKVVGVDEEKITFNPTGYIPDDSQEVELGARVVPIADVEYVWLERDGDESTYAWKQGDDVESLKTLIRRETGQNMDIAA